MSTHNVSVFSLCQHRNGLTDTIRIMQYTNFSYDGCLVATKKLELYYRLLLNNMHCYLENCPHRNGPHRNVVFVTECTYVAEWTLL